MVKINKNEKILKHFINEITPLVRAHHNSFIFNTIDLIPYLNQIVQPSIRPVKFFVKDEINLRFFKLFLPIVDHTTFEQKRKRKV